MSIFNFHFTCLKILKFKKFVRFKVSNLSYSYLLTDNSTSANYIILARWKGFTIILVIFKRDCFTIAVFS